MEAMMNGEIADLSLCELSSMINKGEITSSELVEIYLDRIRRIDGPEGINSFITVDAEGSLRQADECDRFYREKRIKGSLHGLPIAVKDNIGTEGLRTTGGTEILRNWLPPSDAHVITKLKEAGAVILGKTNMHELAFGITTNNPHYGPTRNPYDLSRIPGGSSGGSAAATAAGLCAGSIGTDTGGSVRIPAALCGVVGLKPTLGRVGRGGLMYLSYTRDVIGPITRTVSDSAMILEVISGKDPGDPESSSNPVPCYSRFEESDLKKKHFGVPKNYFFDLIDTDVLRVFDKALEKIKDLGATIKEVHLAHVDSATKNGLNIVLAEWVYLLEDYLKVFNPQISVENCLNQLGPDVRAALAGQKGTSESNPVPGYVYARSIREDRNRLITGFEEAMNGLDGLLLPTTPIPAIKIGEDVETSINGTKVSTFLTFIRNCDPISIAGYPAITVPAGYSESGLPIGLQIVTRPWQEDKLLSMAYSFEQTTNVRKPPIL
jgi:aspartyl-tRNA(Asn)/glutamyl-tRNA(Gln) amidotransferase subunit A